MTLSYWLLILGSIFLYITGKRYSLIEKEVVGQKDPLLIISVVIWTIALSLSALLHYKVI